jgi:tetratricopeptide (TPR) repeat protein
MKHTHPNPSASRQPDERFGGWGRALFVLVVALALLLGAIFSPWGRRFLSGAPKDKSVLELLNERVRKESNNPLAFRERGRFWHDMNQFDRAREDYDEAVRLDPRDPESYLDRGVEEQNLKQYDAALRDYSKAIELDPSRPRAYNNRATLFRMIGRPQDALADLTTAIKLQPDYLDGYFNRGQLYKEMGRPVAAKGDYQKVATFPALTPNTLANRGMALIYLDRLQDAVADFSAAIAQNPNFIPAYRGRSVAYMKMGDIQAAQKDVYQVSVLRGQTQQGAAPPPP